MMRNQGERHPSAKLDAAAVREIREQYATGEWSQRELAIQFKICKSHVGHIVRRYRWRCVP